MLAFTHSDMLLHSGPSGSFESPERLHYFRKLTEVKTSSYPLYEHFVKLVHSTQYLDVLAERFRNIGRFRWGCTACSFINTEGDICQMCQSSKPSIQWEYLNMIDGDTTYINQYTPQALMAAVVSACELSTRIARNKIKNGFALVRPPGHHATKDTGQGFCLLNNTAIAAEAALAAGASRIFIFDWDLHHGNGIQDHFYSRKDVFYCSMHGEGIYPRSGNKDEIGAEAGLGYTLNIPLPKGTGNRSYLSSFRKEVVPVLKSFNPDLILVAAGFDGLESDPMNFFKLTPEVYASILEMMKAICPKIGLILEGGYDVEMIPVCVERCLSALKGGERCSGARRLLNCPH